MAEQTRRGPGRLGCALAAVLAVGAVLGVGAWLGQREERSRTPCERYAYAIQRALDNCHSGLNRDRAHHRQVCERSLEVTEGCLEEIETLSRTGCEQLESAVSGRQLCR